MHRHTIVRIVPKIFSPEPHPRSGCRCEAHYVDRQIDLVLNQRVIAIDPVPRRPSAVTYRRGDRILAVATISRDLQSLQAERAMETAASLSRPV